MVDNLKTTCPRSVSQRQSPDIFTSRLQNMNTLRDEPRFSLRLTLTPNITIILALLKRC